MIREKRNKEKLQHYYHKFWNEKIVDPNVHPWVAESWIKSMQGNIPNQKMSSFNKLSASALASRQNKNKRALDFLNGLYEQSKEHFNKYRLSMLLVDQDDYVIKNYALPFFQTILENIEGAYVGFECTGTTSLSIAKEHRVPFLLFGPEMWIKETHSGDACSAPIIVNGQIRYAITLFSLDQADFPYDLIMSLLLTIKYALEQHLIYSENLEIAYRILDEVPQATYYLQKDNVLLYANQTAKERLGNRAHPSEVFLNYEHLPINKGFAGQACHNKEMRWLTPTHTYEDITTVLPIKNDFGDNNVLVITASIEDLKTTIAHATGYSMRYSLYSMVGVSEEFLALQNKAAKLARHNSHVLLQGEPGTGKQRLAYGIHHSGARATAPIITIHSGNNEQVLLLDLFGNNQDIIGKLSIAKEGTLFIDEIEKMPLIIGDRLADLLDSEEYSHMRIIAACDSNLKKLTDKGLFSAKLFAVLSKTVLRVPPLRKRIEDIEVLAAHILSEMSLQHNLPIKTLAPETVRILESVNWSGNIKQLQGVLESAFFQTSGTSIQPAHIKLPNHRGTEKSWKHDKDAFLSLWKAAGGNISKLSDTLGVSRVTLYRYLKKHNLNYIR